MQGSRAPRAAAVIAARRGALVAALSALVLMLAAAGASAVIVHLPGGRTVSYQPLRGHRTVRPLDALFSNVDYNGGPVMPSNTNYAFYWDPAGAPAYPAEYQEGIDRYFEDLAHDSGGHENVDSVSTQYNDAQGQFAAYESHFGGAIVDTDPYPASGCKVVATCLTAAQIEAELAQYTSAHGLPTDLEHEYFVLTPPGVESCFTSSGRECSAGVGPRGVYCAYHYNVPTAAGELIYADDPYVTGIGGCDDGNHPNDKPSDGALEGGLVHEHNESITDPEPNNAWTDVANGGSEIGDKCEGSMGPTIGTAPDGASYNQVIDGDLYWYQEMWSNQGHTCLQRLQLSGEEPTASFAVTPDSGDEVTFEAGESSAPGGVFRYSWQFNEEGGDSTPVETSLPTVTHTFLEPGTYTVALTVFAQDGTSIGAARTVSVGILPAPTVTKVSPRTGPPAGGRTVKIIGTRLLGTTAVHFGTRTAAFKIESATTILAVSPAGSTGPVAITVTSPDGTSASTPADTFTYSQPTVSEVSPSSGPLAGGSSVTVTGSGFSPGSTTFTFGRVLAPAVECASTTSCTVTVPPGGTAGQVQVIATVAGRRSRKSGTGDLYTYL